MRLAYHFKDRSVTIDDPHFAVPVIRRRCELSAAAGFHDVR